MLRGGVLCFVDEIGACCTAWADACCFAFATAIDVSLYPRRVLLRERLWTVQISSNIIKNIRVSIRASPHRLVDEYEYDKIYLCGF